MAAKYFLRIYIALLSAFLPHISFAQNNKINPTAQMWSETDFAGWTTKRLKWQLDLQYSRQSPYEDVNMFTYNSQLTIRPWLHYYASRNIRLSFFMGLWYNYYIQEVGAREYPEYRTALQTTFYTNMKRSVLTDRFRVELRDIQDKDGAFEQVVRLRYMLKYQYLVVHTAFDKGSVYCFGFDEFFVNSGSNVTGYHSFDQNRLFLGFGYNLNDHLTFETGYFNQLQQHAHDNNLDINHIWQLTLIIDNLNFLMKTSQQKHS